MSSYQSERPKRRQTILKWLMLLAPVVIGGVLVKLGTPLSPTLSFVLLAVIFRDQWVRARRRTAGELAGRKERE